MLPVEHIAWIGTILSLTGQIVTIYKSVWGWVIWLLADLFWLGWNLHQGLLAQTVLYVVYTVITMWAIYKWSPERQGSR